MPDSHGLFVWKRKRFYVYWPCFHIKTIKNGELLSTKIEVSPLWRGLLLFIASSTDSTAWERHVIGMNFVFDGLLWTGSHIVKWLNLGFHRQREKESTNFLFSRPMNSTLNISRVWDRIHFPLFNVGDIINIAFHVTHSVAKNEQITNFKNFHCWKKGSASSS